MSKKNIVIVSVITLLVIGGTIGGYFAWQAGKRAGEQVNMPNHRTQPSTPITSTPSLPAHPPASQRIDTSDWQIYHSEAYGFEVKYPKGWVVRKRNSGSISIQNKENINLATPGGPYGSVFEVIFGSEYNGYKDCPTPTVSKTVNNTLFKCYWPRWTQGTGGLVFDCCSSKLRVGAWANYPTENKAKEEVLNKIFSTLRE